MRLMESILRTITISVWQRMLLAVLACWSLSASGATPGVDVQEELAPVARHEKIGQLVTEFIQKSHYRRASVDDDLSSQVLDRYIKALASALQSRVCSTKIKDSGYLRALKASIRICMHHNRCCAPLLKIYDRKNCREFRYGSISPPKATAPGLDLTQQVHSNRSGRRSSVPSSLRFLRRRILDCSSSRRCSSH